MSTFTQPKKSGGYITSLSCLPFSNEWMGNILKKPFNMEDQKYGIYL